ncbi:MAG TPA: hypothetical protein VK613_07520 [Gaiellaceae bacterium]|nr:hypothetical protein [Gaiellaceae bacterium]
MSRFSRIRRDAGRLERDLRAERPEPPAHFLLGLSKHVVASRPPRQRRASRVAFALALTTFMVGSFASFGGLGYAASEANSAVNVVKKVVKSDHPRVLQKTSARAQYGPATPPEPAAHVKAAVSASGVNAATAAQSGQLPFTGLSLIFTTALGLSLLAVGLILRRREKKKGI